MLRWARSKRRKENIKNEDIWREANIKTMIGLTFLRKRILRWYGHVLRNGGEYHGMLNMQVLGKRRR